ncbi:hypothetical protein C1J03_07995 [Sulfitobacter sp. SK012]|nr:hypothetical protein C1J03_07995 [Sulfitobacter sp. SK012]
MNPPGGGQFYTKLQKALVEAGIPADFRQRFSIYGGEDYANKGAHFVHQGLVRAPGVFNTGFA